MAPKASPESRPSIIKMDGLYWLEHHPHEALYSAFAEMDRGNQINTRLIVGKLQRLIGNELSVPEIGVLQQSAIDFCNHYNRSAGIHGYVEKCESDFDDANDRGSWVAMVPMFKFPNHLTDPVTLDLPYFHFTEDAALEVAIAEKYRSSWAAVLSHRQAAELLILELDRIDNENGGGEE